jgi:hypothetical protein
MCIVVSNVNMSETIVKLKYLKKIQKAYETMNMFFNIDEIDINEFTEETLFIDYWEVQQLCEFAKNNPDNQLYKMWCSRIQEIQDESYFDSSLS